MPMGLPATVRLREVGPRDGLQAEAPIPVDRPGSRLIEALLAAGVRSPRGGQLRVARAPCRPWPAPPRWWPRSGRPPGVVRAALVPNRRGAEMALAAGVDELTVTVAASAAYNDRNVHMTIDESVAELTAPSPQLARRRRRARRRRAVVRLRLALRGRHRSGRP